MTAVTIRHDGQTRLFSFRCDCGWRGATENMSAAAQPVAEHLRACDGEQPASRRPYRPDRVTRRRVADYPEHADTDTDDEPAAPAAHRAGEAHPRSRVTADQVRAMRAAYDNGARQVDLAKQYGISYSTAGSVIRRETWRHVEDDPEDDPERNPTPPRTESN